MFYHYHTKTNPGIGSYPGALGNFTGIYVSSFIKITEPEVSQC
jgi:hypothetical protein